MALPGFPEALVLLFLLSAYGWGRLCRTFCDARIFRFYSFTAVIGLAVLNAVGGLLNLLKWATAPVLFLLLLAGVALATVDLLKRRPWRAGFRRETSDYRELAKSILPLLLVLAAGTGACLTLVPTTVFNLGDDLHTYAPRAVRMIQTGSVGGNAFDASGLDSFGSQSFFHGFFLTGADIRMLNAFDAVACFALCLLFVAEVSLRWRLPWFVGVLGVICVMVINPQSTNISPLYSGALFIAALVVYGSFFERTWLAKRTSRGFRTEVSLALIASTLATLKVTLAFFASLFLLLLYALLFSRTLDRRGVFKSAVTTGLLTAVLILPWVLVQAPVLAQARQLGLEFSDRATLVTKYPSIAAHDIAKLFSTAPLFYGNRLPNFHFLAGICLGIGLLSLPGWLRPPGCTRSVGLSSLVAAGVAVPAVYLLNAHLFMAETAIRYSCPVLIACVAVTCVSFLRFGSASVLPDYRQRVLWVSSLLAVVLLVFAGSFWLRAGLAIHQGISVSFPVDQTYAMLSTQAVARDQTIYLRAIQSRTEPGTAALVWMVAPFHLDFSRNHLFVVSQPGLISPALHFPAGADLESLETYLRKWGIRYVLIEASSPVMDETAREWKRLLTAEYTVYRKLSAYALYFRESLLALAARHRVVYTDGRTLLYELDAPTGTEAGPPASPVHTGDSP